MTFIIYDCPNLLLLFGSVQTAVINVFKGGGLQNNELYILNENVRYVDLTELDSTAFPGQGKSNAKSFVLRQ